MTKRSSKKQFLLSVLSLLLCFSMLLGTTFAWFTDSVTSAGNIIKSGTLDVTLEWMEGNLNPADKDSAEWIDASSGAIFYSELWEPGYTEVKHIKIENEGSLALKYVLDIIPYDENGNVLSVDALEIDGVNLAKAIDVYYVDPAMQIADRNALDSMTPMCTLYDALVNLPSTGNGKLLSSELDTITLALKMQESAGNEYQNKSIGASFAIRLMATQYTKEADSFDNTYDETSKWPIDTVVANDSVSSSVTTVDNKISADLNLASTSGKLSATLPEGVLLNDGASSVTLTLSDVEDSEANITLSETEATLSVDVHIDGISENNDKVIKVDLAELLPVGLNMGNYRFYHVENGVTVEMTLLEAGNTPVHNNYTYDPATGNVTLYLKSFSEIALVANTENAWNGEFNYTWYDASKEELTIANADQLAAFGAIVGGMAEGIERDSFAGKTVKLIADINLGDKDNANESLIFHPIGYYYNGNSSAPSSTVYSFEGTFDGNGHTISSFYQNTWEIKGDYDGNYYKDAMGLFGYVVNGKICNLTVDNFSSDGEFTPTGVIAAYAVNSTFENIAITNCNPRVYNTGNGGIIGIAGRENEAVEKITLKNITVDNSNKITALWGSWDVACGGLVGMYRGNVDGSGNATGDTISFTNCHVSAQIDVYNDVCANYQYYAYRYSGMIIGSVRHNTKNAEGKTIPNMTGIYATGCTVNYGDWNDYYYCEFEKNTMASYSEDYQFSRVDKSEIIFDENGNVTGCTHTHTEAEDKKAIYLPFHQLFTGYSWGVSSIGLEKYSGIVTNLDITEGDQEESVVKFETKFKGDFLYRVGNQNNVSIGSLFAAKDGVTINGSGVWVTVEKVDENSNVSGTFTANTTANTNDWENGTIQFSGTGVVKVTIQDYNFCTPTVLYLEVVDAVNATTATSATANNVVLLNDAGFSSLEVSGGYTLYGNGFTLTCGSDSPALDMGYAFVTLNNGTLDNVQIVCPNFDYAVLYKSNMTESGNRSQTTDKTRYYNVKSGVMVSGNSQILNSRISGGRAAVNVSAGNVVIDNSRIELGAVASLLVGSANSVTLRDVTLVQKPTASTYDSNKTLMGFSVLFVCDANGDAAPVTLEGTLVQNAWVDENDKQYVPSAGQSIISTVLGKTDYLHDIDGNKSLNLGFAYMPESLTSKVNTTTITDNRTNKNDVPYDYAEVGILNGKTYVYSYKNTNGTADSFKTEAEYKPNKYSDIITVNYSDTADGLTTGKSFGTDGWVYELNVDLDKLSGYALDFSKLSMSVNSVNVTDFKVNGNAKPTSPVAVVAGGTTYTLTATVNGKEYTATYKVTGTETSKESPSLVASNYEAGLCVASSYGGTWHGAAPALEGIQIKYWSVAEKQYKTINLSDYTPTTKGQFNGTNTTWTYSPDNGDFTLTLTGGQVHSSNNVYAIPVVCEGKLYFVPAKSSGLVNSGNSARTIPVSYTFKDNNNGDVLTFSHTWSVAENKDLQYNYTDFCKGTMTILEDEGCIVEGTMITMSDGTLKAVEDLSVGDFVMVFNHVSGKYETAPIIFNTHYTETEAKDYQVLRLEFSNGDDLGIVQSHGLFDMTLMEYVYINYDNYHDYIGHKFYTYEGDSIELVNAYVHSEYTRIFCPVSYFHMNSFANGLLNTPNIPGDITGLVNYFEYDSNLKYNEEAMARDIEKYGLYTYDDFKDYISEAAYNSSPSVYLKVAVAKGMITFDEILNVIEYLLSSSLIS